MNVNVFPRSLLDAALNYAAKGWPVFPCGTDKKPLVKNWPGVASTNPEQIRAWWQQWPEANIGCITGPTSGMWVLDIDLPKEGNPHDGRISLAKLEAAHAPLPQTLEQRTGSGGRHLFFAWPEALVVRNTASKLAPGLDVRGKGGYVILAPSGHPSGECYSWVDDKVEIAEAPHWLLKLVTAHRKHTTEAPPAIKASNSIGSTPYGRKALENESTTVADAPVGTRNDTLYHASRSLGQLVAGGELDDGEMQEALLHAAVQSGLPEREALKTIASGMTSGMREPRTAPANLAKATAPKGPAAQSEAIAQGSAWATAREIFPRVAFPWGVLPEAIAQSLKQLGRSCATSATPLPALALSFIAAAVGRTIAIQAKESWLEPLIFWSADIRESGAGKTSPMYLLAQVLTQRQAEEHARYKLEVEVWDRMTPKERQGQTPPKKSRGYFTTNMTLEGVHADLDDHPTGGLAVLLNELSAFIGGQNQYKGGGTDRESWLALHDGKSARISRAKGSVFIKGARVQVCGGIQPGIFRQVFGGENGQYLEDGTVYRCLFTYEPLCHHDLTEESWGEEHRRAWAETLARALDWADTQEQPCPLILTPEAQSRFFTWRNELNASLQDLPPRFRGFMPKAYGYALRLAGTIKVLKCFAAGSAPDGELQLADMELGIQAVSFYLGQAVDALRLLVGEGEGAAPTEVSERTLLLASVLQDMRPQVDNGLLAVGVIQERFNELAEPGQTLSTPRAVGALLRSCGLTLATGKHDANGKRRVHCLTWDDKTESFIDQSLQNLQQLQRLELHGQQGEHDSEECAPGNASKGVAMETLETSETECLHPESVGITGAGDIGDIGDIAETTFEEVLDTVVV